MNAVYGIANAGVSQRGPSSSPISPMRTLALYVAASAIGGTITGAVLGALGGLIPLSARVSLASALAIAAIAIGAAGIYGRALRPLQCDRETPRGWVDRGAGLWAITNGLVLGFGATTRIGFTLWYTIALGALLLGSWAAGAAIYGLYGLTRGAGAWAALRAQRRWDGDRVGLFAMRHYQTSLDVAAAQLLLVGVTILISVGL